MGWRVERVFNGLLSKRGCVEALVDRVSDMRDLLQDVFVSLRQACSERSEWQQCNGVGELHVTDWRLLLSMR